MITEGECYCDTIDTLPGRGSLVPLRMIRAAGNIDDKTFPHYISDYDFFGRIKSAGFKLAVCYDTMIFAHIEETGIVPQRRLTIRQAWREMTDRRSMTNIRDHWRFIDRHAPPHRRRPLLRRLIYNSIGKVLFQTKLGSFTWPVYQALRLLLVRIPRGLWRIRTAPNVALNYEDLPELLQQALILTISPRPFTSNEARHVGLDSQSLVDRGIAVALPEPDWYKFTTLQWSGDVQAAQLNQLLAFTRGMRRLQLTSFREYLQARGARVHEQMSRH